MYVELLLTLTVMEKVVIILAAIPTKYNSSQSSQTSRNNMYFVDPEYNEIEGEAMEVFYVNIHPLTTSATTIPTAEELREYNLANGLSILSIQSNNEEEEAWLMNGLGVVMQYRCFGFTHTESGNHGMFELMKEFRKAPYLELTNLVAGKRKV